MSLPTTSIASQIGICNEWLQVNSRWHEKIMRMTAAQAWALIVVATAVAAIAFFSLHEIHARFGVIWNLMHGEVWLTASCPINQSGSALDALLTSPPANPAPHWPACDLIIPYRWILGLAVAAVVAALIARPRN